MQHYNKYLKNSSFGVEKFNFSLGLLLIQLHRVDVFIGKSFEISSFGDVLPNEFVRVLYCTLLPGRIGIGEEHRRVQQLRDDPVAGELAAVVRRYCQDVPPVWV